MDVDGTTIHVNGDDTPEVRAAMADLIRAAANYQTAETRIEPTGADVLNAARAWTHPGHDACPVCSGPVLTIGIVYLVYTFEPCDCPAADYGHLRERLWHRVCFGPETCGEFRPSFIRGRGNNPAHYTETCGVCGRLEIAHLAADEPPKEPR